MNSSMVHPPSRMKCRNVLSKKASHCTIHRQHDLKSEKRRAQMGVARAALERHTMLLLTSSKTLLRHPESESALQCRDGVFDQVALLFSSEPSPVLR